MHNIIELKANDYTVQIIDVNFLSTTLDAGITDVAPQSLLLGPVTWEGTPAFFYCMLSRLVRKMSLLGSPDKIL